MCRIFFPLLLAAGFLSSCRSVPKPAEPAPGTEPAPGDAAGGMVPGKDVAAVDAWFKTHKTNTMVPPAAETPVITAGNSRFVVDLDGQRTYFYTDNKLVAAGTIASGRKYYRTETGDYTLGQKDLNHRSTSYGNFVSKSGGTLISDVTNGFDPTPLGGRFEGALMKYFMRFHLNGGSTAMGFHRGNLPGYPASHGCVRLSDKMASWFYAKAPLGTPIFVRGTKYGVPYGADQNRPKRSRKVHSSLKDKPVPAAPADPGPESADPVSSSDSPGVLSPAVESTLAPAGSAPAPASDPPPPPADPAGPEN